MPEPWRYAISKDKQKQFDLLLELLHGDEVSEVINACDAGREGELIFRSVYALSGCDKSMKRLWISSMEVEAIREGFANLRLDSEYDNLYESALRRSCADWLVGITATSGIGTNLYLAKIAMDVEAKHTQPDKNGVRIAELDDELSQKAMESQTAG